MQKYSWKNKRIIITGSSGFIGRRLFMRLQSESAKVLGLTHVPKYPDETKVELTNSSATINMFQKFSPDICFHLASTSVVEHGQNSPFETFRNNIMSTLNVLESCRLYRVTKVIVASTVHVYGNSPIPYKEQEQARPSRPYETSKTCSDLIAQSYADSFHLPVLIPRFVNIFGPGDMNFTRIIPKTIKSVLKGEKPTMWGGKAEREYLFIDDAIDAYLRLACCNTDQLEQNRIYNFGTGIPITVSNLISAIIRLSGSSISTKHIHALRHDEIIKQMTRSEKAKRVLGWKPMFELDEGLLQTIDWYRNYFRINGL